MNLKLDSDDVQELLDFQNQELTMEELMEMHEQDIKGVNTQVNQNIGWRLGILQKVSVELKKGLIHQSIGTAPLVRQWEAGRAADREFGIE
ncbi:hypothetical protein TNCV_1589981 [Trichonephila clavipes]|uniref:Uncharacterized protein n=1 Tax=Trichonephila clavipes TaxID=2585209 RepID=A0A8X6RRF9_TRICX|nr:hypothetical protein TNCV_1589981 [Trichonephila clavipes]